jgi:hypothetical protein
MPGSLSGAAGASQTEIIRTGKASKPTEFGKLVQIQEAENQIITHYEIFEHRPSDRELLLPAIEAQQNKLGRVPRRVTADAGFHDSTPGYLIFDRDASFNEEVIDAERGCRALGGQLPPGSA